MGKVVINACFGGFGLSEAAYEWLIAKGVPVRKHMPQEQGADGLYLPQPLNDGEVIFDRELTPVGESSFTDIYHKFKSRKQRGLTGRYWDCWTDGSRAHPLVVGVVEALGAKANGECADLRVVEIPEGVEWEIEEYDGSEHVAEVHRTWR